MKTTALVITFTMISIFSCDVRKSVHKDLTTGLISRGDGLSCDNVYLSICDETISKNSFIYGETFEVNFDNIEGFNKVDNYAFPGMELYVISERGDTALKTSDLYIDLNEGSDNTPLLLLANVTAADPIFSNNEYTLYIQIWDKKGDGNFSAEMDFNVVPNDKIKIESNQLFYDEIYLFSQQRQMTITNNTAGFDESIFMMFEGLDGFVVEGSMVYPGLSLVVHDADDNLILNEDDLIGETGMDYFEVNSQLAPNFVMSGSLISNPVTCEITIWDKKGDGSIKASAQLHIQ